MTDRPTSEFELDPQLEADLVALADGRLDPARREAIEARIAADRTLRAALETQRAATSLIATASSGVVAPPELRQEVDRLAAGPRPARRARRWWLPAGGLAAAATAAVVVAVLLTGGGALTLTDTLAPADRPPETAAALDPARPTLLAEQIDGVTFPNFGEKFDFAAAGARSDVIDGRATRTVFYERGGDRVAYTIVAGEALADPADAGLTTREGVAIRTLRTGDRNVVTWRREGHTCVMSSASLSTDELAELASWKGKGTVSF